MRKSRRRIDGKIARLVLKLFKGRRRRGRGGQGRGRGMLSETRGSVSISLGPYPLLRRSRLGRRKVESAHWTFRATQRSGEVVGAFESRRGKGALLGLFQRKNPFFLEDTTLGRAEKVGSARRQRSLVGSAAGFGGRRKVLLQREFLQRTPHD